MTLSAEHFNAVPRSAAGHPAWCAADLKYDNGGTMHISAECRIEQNAYPVEEGAAYVGIESGDGEPTALRLEGGHTPMTPVEALRLAAVLQELALSALSTPADEAELLRWSAEVSIMPTEDFAATFSYGTARAGQIQGIIADLLAQDRAETAAAGGR